LEKLLKFTLKTEAYFCKDFKEVMKDNDKLKEDLLKLESKYEKEKDTYEKKLKEIKH